MNIQDVVGQCVMLSNGVVNGFSGKLWGCTECKDAGLMKSWTLKANFLNKSKFHKMKPTCKLFRSDLLPESKKHWGKNMDYVKSGSDKKEEFVYARPVELRAERQKKRPVPPSSTGQTGQNTDPVASVVASITDAIHESNDRLLLFVDL